MNLTMNEEHGMFHYELGNCITYWAFVEQSLCNLAAGCVGAGDYNTIVNGFYGIENFRSKLQFVDRMVQSAVSDRPELLRAWTLLDKRITQASVVRNQLVHRTIGIYDKAPVGKRYALVPHLELHRAVVIFPLVRMMESKPPAEAMFLRQLAAAQSRFFGVQVSIANFKDSMAGDAKFFPESLERGLAIPDLRSLRSRFRKSLGVPIPPTHRERAAVGDAAAEVQRQQMAEEAQQAQSKQP